MRLPNTAPTILHEALEDPGPRLVRLPKDEKHAPLMAIMDSAPPAEVALVAIQAAGKPVAVILASDLVEPEASPGKMLELARAAGEALERLLRDRRK